MVPFCNYGLGKHPVTFSETHPSNGIPKGSVVMRLERDGVLKFFPIWLDTEETLNKNAGSLPFRDPRGIF